MIFLRVIYSTKRQSALYIYFNLYVKSLHAKTKIKY